MAFLRRIFDVLLRPIRAILYYPLRLVSAPRRFWGMSLPARVALFVFFLLLIVVVLNFVVFSLTGGHAGWEHERRHLWIELVLLVVTPWVVYIATRLWLEGERSRFPDIDAPWRAGMAALAENGLDITDIPLFLIVGARDERQVKALLDAADLSLCVRDVPQGPAALHWYASRDAIYLTCTETCRLGKLAKMPVESPGRPTHESDFRPRPRPGGMRGITGTIVVGDADEAEADEAAASPPDSARHGREPAHYPADMQRTMVVDGTADFGPAGGPGPAAGPAVAVLDPKEGLEQSRRLEYVCQLVSRARRPVCPINGILSLLPFATLDKGGPRGGTEVQRAAKEDLATIRRSLKLRAPVIALVVGMEQEGGFRELVRRVGRERAKNQRFGKGFSLFTPAVPKQMEALTLHACGAFEDWAYRLFREEGGLNKPGNMLLYRLLCKIRSSLCRRLTNLLTFAYAHDPSDRESAGDPLLFSGCYFAATGDTEDRRAFVKSVFGKLLAEEEQLEWTTEALEEDAFYQRLTQIGLFVIISLVVAILAIVWYGLQR